MSKTGLVIIFNHPYAKNLEKLRFIYGKRFSVLRFLMPFYDGNEPDVIPVFEAGDYFHGFFHQAQDLLLGLDCDGFLFIGDDLIIHPGIDETNAEQYLHVENSDVGICETEMINREDGFSWIHARSATTPFVMNTINWRDVLPLYEEAMERFATYFGRPYPEIFDDVFFKGRLTDETDDAWKHWLQRFFEWNGKTFDIHYPMAFGYSDILYIRKSSYKRISWLCAVLAPMRVFVEIAIPTTIILTTPKDRVTLFSDYYSQDACHTLWDHEEKEKIETDYGRSWNNLVSNWPDEWFFVHPVKLSRWDVG